MKELTAYEQLFVGFSGGLDSTVLLHQLSQQANLKAKLTAVYINHGLSANALGWQRHCQKLCEQWQVHFLAIPVQVDRQGSLEEAARIARYQALTPLIKKNNCLLMGHHLNDQAETLLLQLCRGAGVDGLAAIAAKSAIGEGDLRRPLLHLSRNALQAYATRHQLSWINDESNQDTQHSRNFLRQNVLPILQIRWKDVAQNLARTAEHCQGAQANLNDLARLDCPQLAKTSRVLAVSPLRQLSRNRLSNVLRVWLRQNNVRMPNTLTFHRLIDEMILAAADSHPEIRWGHVTITRYQQTLYLSPPLAGGTQVLPWTAFPKPLQLEMGLGKLTAKVADEGLMIPPDSHVEIRFRQGGERFHWHGQNKSLKKLLQEWKIPPWQRQQIPLLYLNGQLAAVIGYALSDSFFHKATGQCYTIARHVNH